MSKLHEIEASGKSRGPSENIEWLIARVRKLETAHKKVRKKLVAIAESEATMGTGDIGLLLEANELIHGALKED